MSSWRASVGKITTPDRDPGVPSNSAGTRATLNIESR